MVNHGPSGGCRRCRARKVKCDQTKPRCRRCAKSGVECPGYDLFRLEKGIKRSRPSQPNALTTRQTATEQSSEQGEPHAALSRSLSEDPQELAITYFFQSLVGNAYYCPVGYIPELLAQPKIPTFLRRSIDAVAYSFTSFDPRFPHLKYDSVREYALATREIKDVIDQNVAFDSDHMLMALHCLYTWELSLVLVMQPHDHTPHLKGQLSILMAKPYASLTSDMARSIYKHICCHMVFRRMSSIDTAPTFDLFLDASLFKYDAYSENTVNEHLLAINFQDFPSLCDRGNLLARRLIHGECFPDEATSYLEDAQVACDRILEWQNGSTRLRSVQSYELPPSSVDHQPRYPKRIDSYTNIIVAAECNIIRMSYVNLLAVMAKVRKALDVFLDPTIPCPKISSAESYEAQIQQLADDVCASIPFYMSPNHKLDLDEPEYLLQYYPHTAADLRLQIEVGPSIIRSMCYTTWPLIQLSIVETIPVSQRQWARSYVMLIARHSGYQQKTPFPFARRTPDIPKQACKRIVTW